MHKQPYLSYNMCVLGVEVALLIVMHITHGEHNTCPAVPHPHVPPAPADRAPTGIARPLPRRAAPPSDRLERLMR